MQRALEVLVNNGLNMSQQCDVTTKQVIPHWAPLIEVVYKSRRWSHSHTRKTVYSAGHPVCREIET